MARRFATTAKGYVYKHEEHERDSAWWVFALCYRISFSLFAV
jgi:hypothetical protein